MNARLVESLFVPKRHRVTNITNKQTLKERHEVDSKNHKIIKL